MDSITELLERIPLKQLPIALRSLEEHVLGQVKGQNILALQAAYRMAARTLKREGKLMRYDDLPQRMRWELFDRARGILARRPRNTVTAPQYTLLRERLEQALRDHFIALRPETKRAFPGDPELERARRELIYAKQWEEICARFDVDQKNLRQGPLATAVWCSGRDKPFASARKAAAWLRKFTGNPKFRRSDIRTAIKRRSRCGGFHWGYDRLAVPAMQKTGRERPVVCLDRTDLPPFPSQCSAAKFAGVSPSKMADALMGDGTVGGLRFAWCEPAAAEAPPTEAEMFPLFAGAA